MSAPPLTRPASTAAPAGAPAPPVSGSLRIPALACLGLALLSLLGPSQPTYDPWAWLIWGREITQWDLVTTTGPSWKPLPVLFTTPFALLGDAAPEAWLVVARTCGLLAVVVTYRLGARFAGPVAGVIAAAGLVTSKDLFLHVARGNSEGMLVLFGLLAAERHLDGRRRDAFLSLLIASLVRPEVWPVFGLYGVWLLWRERRVALVAAAFAANAILWLLPEYLGSGDLLRAAARAREVNANHAGAAEHPFLEVLGRTAEMLAVPILAAALLGLVLLVARWRAGRAGREDRVLLALTAGALAVVGAVGIGAEVGFSGNVRYMAVAAGVVAVLAGVGVVRAGRALRERASGAWVAGAAVLAVLASAPFAVVEARELGRDAGEVGRDAALLEGLDRALERTGGRAAVARCGVVATGPYQVPALAWRLRIHSRVVQLEADPPGTLFAPDWVPLARDTRFPVVAREGRWLVRRACSR